MKKIFQFFIIILLIFSLYLNYYQYHQYQQHIIKTNQENKSSELLSMMIENENGDYKESENNEWPSNGYILNKDRSGCENGGTLEYNDNNVYVKASSSDRCYVYFDIDNIGNRCRNQELTSCFIANKTLDQNLIYHDGKKDYENMPNSNLEAGDLSYRFVGANPNNYVCFGGNCSNDPSNVGYKYLYRIIGFFKNEDSGQYEMKIIKADAATKDDLGDQIDPDGSAYESDGTPDPTYYKGKLKNYGYYYWNSTDSAHLTYNDNTNTNMWKDSNLNTKNLNEKFYNAIDETYKSMVVEHKWLVGAYWNTGDAKSVYDYELGDNKLTSSSNNCYTQDKTIVKDQIARECNGINDLIYNDDKAHVGLMYISDYMYGTLPEYWITTADSYTQDDVKNSDWLYLGITEWTISRDSYDGGSVRDVNFTGRAVNNRPVYNSIGVRPVLYLTSNVKISGGTGTGSNPFKLSL